MNKVTALQTAILSLYVVVTSCHMLLVYATLSRTGSASHPFVCLEVLSILMVTLSWVGVMAVDPSVDTKQDGYFSFSKPTCSLVRHLQVPTSRYCAICAQNTLGMDHHCLWLNCCIGRRNYQSFLLLSLSLVFQMLLQSVFALYALIEGVLRNNMTYLNAADAFSGSNLFILEILLAIDVIVSVVVLVFLASLVFFHMYLICIRKTSTFEWVMRRRYKVADFDATDSRESSLQERRRQTEREEWQAKLECSKGATYSDSATNTSYMDTGDTDTMP